MEVEDCDKEIERLVQKEAIVIAKSSGNQFLPLFSLN